MLTLVNFDSMQHWLTLIVHRKGQNLFAFICTCIEFIHELDHVNQ